MGVSEMGAEFGPWAFPVAAQALGPLGLVSRTERQSGGKQQDAKARHPRSV